MEGEEDYVEPPRSGPGMAGVMAARCSAERAALSGVAEEEELSPSGTGSEGGEDLNLSHDPFNNFSFTNFTGLSAANMEKIAKLREHFNRRSSYSGPPDGPG